MRVVGDGHSFLRRVAVAARPAVKGVAWLDWIIQRKGSCLVGIISVVLRSNAAAVKVIGDGVSVAGIQRTEVVGADRRRGFPAQIRDATEACDAEGAGCACRNGTTECEYVGAATRHIRKVPPATGQLGGTGGDDLAEGHAHINRIAFGVVAWSHGNRQHGRGGDVHSLDFGLDIIGVPSVLIFA